MFPSAALVVALIPTMTFAAAPFTLDLVGWNKTAKVTDEQKKIALAYLEAAKLVTGFPNEHKVAQVVCTELVQDLVATHRFFHCLIVYEANAVDGGPHDSGQVLAWDGKRALLHQWTTRRDEDPPRVRLAAKDPEPDWRKLETVSGLEFRSPELWHEAGAKDEAGAKLSAALDAELARRAATLKPGPTLPAWLLFALSVHFDVPTLEWTPGLPTEAAVKKQFQNVASGYASATKLAASKEPASFGGVARFSHGGLWGVYVQFDAKGFGFRERTIGFVPAVYG